MQAINVTHDVVHAQMDVKLRSLICMGLNEQVLHLWFEVFGSSMNTVHKWLEFSHIFASRSARFIDWSIYTLKGTILAVFWAVPAGCKSSATWECCPSSRSTWRPNGSCLPARRTRQGDSLWRREWEKCSSNITSSVGICKFTVRFSEFPRLHFTKTTRHDTVEIERISILHD